MDRTVEIVRDEALWFEPVPDGFPPLLNAIGGARVVLIGEVTHGTHEFYEDVDLPETYPSGM